MTDLGRNLGVFLRVYLPRDRGASRHTIESYKVSLKLLVLFAAERLSVRPCVIEVEQLTTQLILDFLDSLERERENTVATRNVRLAAIKALFRFLEYRSACYVDLSRQVHAIPKKRSDQKLIDWLERHELQALLDAPDIRTAAGVRDRAMLHLAYAAALRVSELTALRLDSLGQPDIDTVRVMGKGRRERILPLWRETRSTLVDWLNIRPSVEDNHLFLNARGVVMGRHGFARRLSCHAAVAAKKVPSIARKRITPPLSASLLCRSYLGSHAGHPKGLALAGPRHVAEYGNLSPCQPGAKARTVGGKCPSGAQERGLHWRTGQPSGTP